jgi:hypothetical protein
MMTFKQFLIEMPMRSPERAVKLFHYINKRRGEENHPVIKNFRTLDDNSLTGKPTQPGHPTFDDLESYMPGATKQVRRIHLNKIYTHQAGIAREVMPPKIDKSFQGHSSQLPVVIGHPNGNYYLWDGNHRVAAARLRGEKYIVSDVWSKHHPT